jgi:sigma-B regulation protein RsbU (phosphoserine phosphatase)
VATAPLMDFGFSHPPAHENSNSRLAELVRLQKFAQRITSTLDIEELVPRIVDEVSNSLGCVEISLYLRDPQQSDFVLAGVHGCTMYGKGHRLKAGDGMVGHVAVTGKMHYAPDVTVDPYYIACEPDTRSEVAIPLEREGNMVGVFIASHCEVNAFCDDQLRLLQGMCAHVAVAVHNARRFGDEREQRERMTREAEEARSIQQALLPRTSPLIPGLSVTGLSIPAGSVGGDWYDFIPLSDGRWGFVLADVSGKGMAAALLMSATRGMLRSLVQTGAGPADVLLRLNNMMIEDFPRGRFVTMTYAELDPASHILRIANAGHLSPLLVEPSGHRWIDHEHGLPLGISASRFSETQISLTEPSRLAFYSDGITEAEVESGEEYGAERLLAQMQMPEVSVESLLSDVRKFSNGCGLRDDATVILLQGRGKELGSGNAP